MYSIKLLKKEIVAENTLLLTFERPKELEFEGGQYVSIKLLDTPHQDERGNCKVFSIASAPYQDVLEFSMRKSESAFKKNIDQLEIGGSVEITPPVGKFLLPQEQDQTIIFLVGGIGITPARSILKQSNHESRGDNFFLFYSNRRPEDAAFIDDFNDLQNINLTVVNTMTNIENSTVAWDGETGFITKEMIQKYIPEYIQYRFYIVGTGGFINAMRSMLEEQGVSKERILFDNFGSPK
jgi:ferredoxin-NADP reductase